MWRDRQYPVAASAFGVVLGLQEGSRVTVEGCIVASAHPHSAGGIAIVALTFAERNPGAATCSE
jgi:hypothetical protein